LGIFSASPVVSAPMLNITQWQKFPASMSSTSNAKETVPCGAPVQASIGDLLPPPGAQETGNGCPFVKDAEVRVNTAGVVTVVVVTVEVVVVTGVVLVIIVVVVIDELVVVDVVVAVVGGGVDVLIVVDVADGFSVVDVVAGPNLVVLVVVDVVAVDVVVPEPPQLFSNTVNARNRTKFMILIFFIITNQPPCYHHIL
jgi:hypothetical protein